jgi:hypothetical protein
MRKIATIVVFVTTVAGCVSADDPHWTDSPLATKIDRDAPYDLTAQQLRMVRSDTAKTLKDPGLARFGHIDARKGSEGSIAVCGYVSAPDFGDYNAAFIGVIPSAPNNLRFRVIKIGASQSDRTDIKKACRQSGIDLIGRE